MDFKLRPYQESFSKNIAVKLKEKHHIIACGATGSGKTKTFVAITHKAIVAKKTALILTESRAIFDQISDEFKNVHEIKAGIQDILIYRNGIYLAMAQTLAKRPFIIQSFSNLGQELIIINDEAHIGTSSKLLKQLLNCYIIGFTATPRWKEAKHLTEIYKDIVIGAQPQWLIENGYLAPYYHFARVAADLGALQIKNGEYDNESQKKAFERAEVYQGISKDLRQFSYYKAMVFCSSKEHADHTAAALEIDGYKCAIVHTGNKESDYELFQFKTSPKVNICVSVGMLTKGFDFPPVDLIILNRATTSLPLYLQMCGRGSRVAPGKKRFTVVDYGGNGKRLGLWNVDRDWGVLWCDKKKKKEKEEITAVKDCPKCGFINEQSASICGACGHEFQKTKEQEATDTILVELTNEYNGLRGRKLSELAPKELKIYRDFTGKKKFCIRIARSNGEQYLNDYAKICGYNSGFMRYLNADTTLTFNDYTIL